MLYNKSSVDIKPSSPILLIAQHLQKWDSDQASNSQ